MTTSSLPVSRLINVAVQLTPAGASTQDLSTLLILGSSPVIDAAERFRSYGDIEAVAADFGTTLPEYLAAVLWFEQVPQPSQLRIGRWFAAAGAAYLRGAPLSAAEQLLSNFTGIADGRFTYTLNGGSPSTTAPINLTGALTLPGVAALVSAQTPGITFAWNPSFGRFEAVTAATGSTASISFLGAPGTGTDLSSLLEMSAASSGAYVSPGAAAESAVYATSQFDLNFGQRFYGLTIIGASDADHVAVSDFVAAAGNKHVYFVSTQEAGVAVPAVTTDIASVMQAAKYLRTWTQYSSSNPYAAVSAAARALTVDYNGNNTVISLMYKQEPGIVPESLNSQQVDALEAKNCNVFVQYDNSTAIVEQGKTASGTFLDVVTGTDWLSLDIQTAVYNLLYTSPTKIPQTDAGTQQILNVIEGVCAQGVVNGLLAPGVWNSSGFGKLRNGDYLPKGYYVYAPSVDTQSQADRAKRKSVPIQVAVKLAGAVHTVDILINVNQ